MSEVSVADLVEYRDVEGYEGIYRVGSDGTVWSKYNSRKRLGDEWVLYDGWVDGGYRRVQLRGPAGIRFRNVHQLVAYAFLGNPPTAKHTVAHCNGTKLDNRLENLRWATMKEQHDDIRRHGTRQNSKGEKSPVSRLREHEVIEIRLLASCGLSQREIADRFRINQSTVSNIVARKRWSHVA